MAPGSDDLLTKLLRDVSRSFYLTLRGLPRAVRPQIGLAYLLARTSDTIADTEAVPKEERLRLLSAFGERILRHGRQPLHLEKLSGQNVSPPERRLLLRIEDALAVLSGFELADQQRIREVLGIIISGQALDVERFVGANADHIAALETDEQLDDYIYRVAGCVGEFWTKMCRARLFPDAVLNDTVLIENGVRFGKGLQLVNVLRDLPADLRLGRCYLPRRKLLEAGLMPADLLNPDAEPRFRSFYSTYLDLAEAHLEAGWAYTNGLPFSQMRVRLVCAWPILIGMQTLSKLRTANVLEAGHRLKISRPELRRIVFRSVLWYPWPGRWRGLFASEASSSAHCR